MQTGDYFFLIFLGVIAGARLVLLSNTPGPTIKGFRVRHYMYGVILVIIAFLFKNLTIYAFGLGLIADELPPILRKGPGHKDEQWNGCKDYHSQWCVAGVLVIILIVFIFRTAISGWVI